MRSCGKGKKGSVRWTAKIKLAAMKEQVNDTEKGEWEMEGKVQGK